MNLLRRKAWSPYLVGAAIGVLSWFSFATADRQIGITTAFEYTAASREKRLFQVMLKRTLILRKKHGRTSRRRSTGSGC